MSGIIQLLKQAASTVQQANPSKVRLFSNSDKRGQICAYDENGETIVGYYDFTVYFAGVPANNALMASWVANRAAKLLTGLPTSAVAAKAAATAAVSLLIKKNGTTIGSIDFGIGGTVATFTFAADVSLAVGDLLEVYNAAAADATLGNVVFAIGGELT